MARVALVAIVRDEARCIARCLQSARAFVDEIIILDTGSVDATVGIAQGLGAVVHQFAWNDDFSSARNAALGYSSADWNLILDADEWIDGSVSRSAFAGTLAASQPFIGLLPVASEFDLHGGVAVAISWLPRLLPRGVRYQGTIHEQPVSALPRRKVQLPVVHDGYRQARLADKQGRNEQLLLRALETEPGNPYLHYQLGKDYEVYEHFEQAVASFTTALALARKEDSFRHDLVVRTMFSMKKAGQLAAAIKLSEEEMPNWGHSPDFYFVLGDVLLELATQDPDPVRAFGELFSMIEASWLKCLELGEQPHLAGAVRGRGSFLAAHNLAVIHEGAGHSAQAAHFRKLAALR